MLLKLSLILESVLFFFKSNWIHHGVVLGEDLIRGDLIWNEWLNRKATPILNHLFYRCGKQMR